MGVSNKSDKFGLCSPLNKADKNLNFSLVDYLNNYFTSNKPANIIEFYNGFENRDQLIRWMKERPKGTPIIHEVNGEKDVIVVIPTKDFHGEYASECRNDIFKGLHIIFVESGAMNDFYFNISHYVNTGIKKAIEYNPKWIVISGDDMQKVDNPDTLKSELFKLDPSKIDVVFTEPSPTKYHSKPSLLGRPNLLGRIYYFWIQKTGIAPYDFWIYLYKDPNLMKKLGIEIILLPKHLVSNIFFKKLKPVVMTMAFSIISGNFASREKGRILDESFINGADDWDFSFRTFYRGLSYSFIGYRIEEYIGMSLGNGGNRAIRDLANVSLFNYLYYDDFK